MIHCSSQCWPPAPHSSAPATPSHFCSPRPPPQRCRLCSGAATAWLENTAVWFAFRFCDSDQPELASLLCRIYYSSICSSWTILHLSDSPHPQPPPLLSVQILSGSSVDASSLYSFLSLSDHPVTLLETRLSKFSWLS